MKKEELPTKIPVFPLSNFIIFPDTTVPLNIFEPRYLQMVDDCMKSERCIGIVQPKKSGKLKKPDLFNIGCIGKITSFNETEDGRYLILINGVCRFKIQKEVETNKLYRECNVRYEDYLEDLGNKKNENLELSKIINKFKSLFEKLGYSIDWKELENQDSKKMINSLAMASPFSIEEKQVLLETINIKDRESKLDNIINTYLKDDFSNTTIQ
tara:strand:- start:4245 stop:4880 length:636 start_codon:yes stop_codon:yes gene_type:complete